MVDDTMQELLVSIQRDFCGKTVFLSLALEDQELAFVRFQTVLQDASWNEEGSLTLLGSVHETNDALFADELNVPIPGPSGEPQIWLTRLQDELVMHTSDGLTLSLSVIHG